MAAERFHRAARDGILAVLKEATRKECNSRDEDGMTPTMWAAFEGHLEALRLLIARGGEPDKGDNLGNTCLHFAAERGHMSCVSFLVNFGANMYSLNIEYRTPKELAAVRARDDILRFLDEASAKAEATNRKDVKAKKDKAQKEFEKKTKEYEKLKKKAEKFSEDAQARLQKERQKMGTESIEGGGMPHRTSVLGAIKNRTLGPGSKYAPSQSRRYSEIVGTVSGATAKKYGTSAVQKKLQKRVETSDDMKIVENGNNGNTLTGLRRDSEVMFVGRLGRQGLEDLFSDADYEKDDDLPEESEDVLLQAPASIFDRPGFGSFAFRKSISSTFKALPTANEGDENDEESIGSAGSLAKRAPHHNDVSDLEDGHSSDEDDDDDDDQFSPIQTFLAANGLGEYIRKFLNEKIDLDSLMLLTDADINSLGLPLGPRRKLTIAIENRNKALAKPGQVQDSQL